MKSFILFGLMSAMLMGYLVGYERGYTLHQDKIARRPFNFSERVEMLEGSKDFESASPATQTKMMQEEKQAASPY